MIWQIMHKEILEKLFSMRFILLLLLAVCLFAISGFVFVDKYKQQSQDYWKETNKNLSTLNERSNQLYQLALYKQQVFRKPKPLSLCAEGFEKSFPNCFEFNAFAMDYPKAKNNSNFTLAHFSDIDWVYIISLILSFTALLLTYDTISGEKEAGTLRLILAGSISRHKILLGKYLSVMFILMLSLIVGLLVNLIIMTSSNMIVFGAMNWLKIISIFLLSFLYLSIFVLLGIFVSSRTSHSANCMVVLLLVWVGLVILIPSFGRIISDTFRKSPTKAEWARKINEEKKNIFEDAGSGKYGENAVIDWHDPEAPFVNTIGHSRYQNALVDSKNALIEEHLKQMIEQAFTGRIFTCFSPSVVYQRASETIAGTGINRWSDLYSQVKMYQADLKEHIHSHDAEDPDSLHLLFPQEWLVVNWNAISKKPVDFKTVPKFQEQDLPLGQSLKLAIWDIGLLVLFNLVFFAAAFVSFLRYDVR